ncbi:hypothetical protein EDD16DRAFT_1514885 [Pisolithus croceorrhizus]|nr:hypothetical protein EDD16DRAFT_1514885 [Pisolithus croceorrhizus]
MTGYMDFRRALSTYETDLSYYANGTSGPGFHLEKKHMLSIARSLRREKFKPSTQIRISRNVKFIYGGQERLGEVQYFTRLVLDAAEEDAEEARFEDIALVSSHVLMVSKLSDQFVVVHVKSIKSVIGTVEECFFLMEKPGLDISQLGITYSVYQEEDDCSADIE